MNTRDSVVACFIAVVAAVTICVVCALMTSCEKQAHSFEPVRVEKK